MTDLAQLLAIPEADLDVQLAAFGLLKGHAIKLKLSLPALKGGAKPQTAAHSPAAGFTIPSYATAQPTYTPLPTASAPKPAPLCPPVAREAEKIAAKLKDIDTLRTTITQAKQVILALDVPGYRRILDLLGELQQSLRAGKTEAAELEKETAGEEDETEKDVAMCE